MDYRTDNRCSVTGFHCDEPDKDCCRCEIPKKGFKEESDESFARTLDRLKGGQEYIMMNRRK